MDASEVLKKVHGLRGMETLFLGLKKETIGIRHLLDGSGKLRIFSELSALRIDSLRECESDDNIVELMVGDTVCGCIYSRLVEWARVI